MSTSVCQLAIVEGVATITLDSPANRNALSRALRTELHAHLSTAVTDDAVRVIVLTHTGPAFCSGLDLREVEATPAHATAPVHDLPPLLATITESPTPVVARVAGAVRAGGLGLMAACDVVVAAETSSFAFSEVRLGLVPAVIATAVLPRLTTPSGRELLLTGEVVDAARAEAVGLVNRSVPGGELDAEVERYVSMLSLGGPLALGATKAMLRSSPAAPCADDAADLLALSELHFASREGREGVRAARERREPDWRFK